MLPAITPALIGADLQSRKSKLGCMSMKESDYVFEFMSLTRIESFVECNMVPCYILITFSRSGMAQ